MIILSWKGFYIFEVQAYNLLYHQSLTESNNLLYVVLQQTYHHFHILQIK